MPHFVVFLFIKWLFVSCIHFLIDLGLLNFVKLDGIDVRSRKTMEAITALCPLLKEVHFIGSFSDSPFNEFEFGHEVLAENGDDILTGEELQTLLSSSMDLWSNVIHKNNFLLVHFYF